MKKLFVSAALLLAFVLLAPLPLRAADTDYSGSTTKWNVEFTSDKEMDSTFDGTTFNDVLSEMQPGDSVLFTVDLKNGYKETTRWYMTNEVLKSLEEVSSSRKSAASSGAYEYVLTYTNSSGTSKELFNSETVGGDNPVSSDLEGLNEATDNLEDYFYLDSLSKGKGGTITLKVALDGETQGNAYQDTKAQLQMNFAVELESDATKTVTKTKTRTVTRVAKTGDDTNWTLYFILAAVSALCMLILGRYSMKLRKKEREEG